MINLPARLRPVNCLRVRALERADRDAGALTINGADVGVMPTSRRGRRPLRALVAPSVAMQPEPDCGALSLHVRARECSQENLRTHCGGQCGNRAQPAVLNVSVARRAML